MEEPLAGGVANAGGVVRVGAHVLRPSNPHSSTIHGFLQALRTNGFDGASEPVGIDADGRERLVFIQGDVPIPPYPMWAQSDGALRSISALIARFHAAARSFDPSGKSWSDEMVDPEALRDDLSCSQAPRTICHNDVCLENVVFRDGIAVGLLDFDFAAPGRPVYDLAQFARMCVPIDDDVNAARLGWEYIDKPTRLRLVADEYGLDAEGRADLLLVLSASIERGGQFVKRRVEAGDPNFIQMWNEMGGMERFDRRRRWWDEQQPKFAAALGVGI